jgi:GNAT superfamily N-acetyltransferase
VIESLSLDDLERCMDLAERVGWPRERAKWRMLLSLGRGHATRDGARLSSMVVITPHDEGSFVAMMVVDPALQGRGVGRRLLEHALVEAPRPVMLYATNAGRKLYEKLGFVEVGAVQKFGGVVSHAHELPPIEDREAFIAADARAFGGRRRRVLEHLLDIADRTVTNGRGYAVRFHNGAMNVIGPVIADSEDDAIELVDAALTGATGMTRIDVAVSSPRLAAHVRARGFAQKEDAPLMVFGGALRGDRGRYHAIVLQAFG